MSDTLEMPKKYINMVGKEMTFSGGLFSRKRAIPDTTFTILNWRWGRGYVVNLNQPSKFKHPTIEFLLKNDSMKRSRWCRAFPVREINLQEKRQKS